jgi:hyperosmotically inducible periplasmic protein
MNFSKCLVTTILTGIVFAGSACTDQAVDDTKRATGTALDATKQGADKAIDVSREAGSKTKEIAGQVAEKTKEVAATTGAAMTDGWITTKVKAKFADEKSLESSTIHVETTDHVVTLTGTVASREAKARAEAIATGTEGVRRVADYIEVK